MICPKCEEGIIKKIFFKKNQRNAYLCDCCSTLWFEGEQIDGTSGKTIQSHTIDGEMEYTFVDVDEADPDDQSVMYPTFK